MRVRLSAAFVALAALGCTAVPVQQQQQQGWKAYLLQDGKLSEVGVEVGVEVGEAYPQSLLNTPIVIRLPSMPPTRRTFSPVPSPVLVEDNGVVPHTPAREDELLPPVVKSATPVPVLISGGGGGRPGAAAAAAAAALEVAPGASEGGEREGVAVQRLQVTSDPIKVTLIEEPASAPAPAPVVKAAAPASAPVVKVDAPASVVKAAAPAPVVKVTVPIPVVNVPAPAPIPVVKVAVPSPVVQTAVPAPVVNVAAPAPAPVVKVAAPTPVVQAVVSAPVVPAPVPVAAPVVVATPPEPLAAPAPPMPSLNVPFEGGQFHSQDEAKQYSFGYWGGPSTRLETKDYLGRVSGSFAYVNPEGDVQVRKYAAAPAMGFKVAASDLPQDTPAVAKVKAFFAQAHADIKAARS